MAELQPLAPRLDPYGRQRRGRPRWHRHRRAAARQVLVTDQLPCRRARLRPEHGESATPSAGTLCARGADLRGKWRRSARAVPWLAGRWCSTCRWRARLRLRAGGAFGTGQRAGPVPARPGCPRHRIGRPGAAGVQQPRAGGGGYRWRIRAGQACAGVAISWRSQRRAATLTAADLGSPLAPRHSMLAGRLEDMGLGNEMPVDRRGRRRRERPPVTKSMPSGGAICRRDGGAGARRWCSRVLNRRGDAHAAVGSGAPYETRLARRRGGPGRPAPEERLHRPADARAGGRGRHRRAQRARRARYLDSTCATRWRRWMPGIPGSSRASAVTR